MLLEALIAMALQRVDSADDANLALTTCGFAAYRYASERNQPLDQFASTLSARCSRQITQMRSSFIALETLRGKGRPNATASADALIAEFRANFAAQYRHRAETEAQLRALDNAARMEGTPDDQ